MADDPLDGVNKHVATLMGIIMGDSYASSAPLPNYTDGYTSANLKTDLEAGPGPPTAEKGEGNADLDLTGDAQLVAAKAAFNAGFRGEALVNIIAIAGRESGYNPGAMGDTKIQTGTWGPSVGLFQIRTIKGQTGSGSARDIQRLQNNPMEQARAAFELSGGGKDFGPWRLHGGGFLDSTNVVNARRLAKLVEGGG